MPQSIDIGGQPWMAAIDHNGTEAIGSVIGNGDFAAVQGRCYFKSGTFTLRPATKEEFEWAEHVLDVRLQDEYERDME